jgi:hypothetical protein
MARKPTELPKPATWNVYKNASKAVWLGSLEAADEQATMERGAAGFKVASNRFGGYLAAGSPISSRDQDL